MSTTPNMNLSLPTPSTTLGPAWAIQLNAAMDRIDQHDHSTGNGAKITVPAININTDLSFNDTNIDDVKSLRLSNLAAVLSGLSDIRSIYTFEGNLYYNNAAGDQIRITSGDGLDASSVGGIGGDYGGSTASAFYTSANSTFTWEQSSGVNALMDTGGILIRERTASANAITLQSPSSLAAAYTATLPAGLPGSEKIMTMNSSGQIGVAYDVDNSSLEVASNTLRVKSEGVTPAMQQDIESGYAEGTFTTSGAGTFTLLSVTINKSANRSVMISVGRRSGTTEESFLYARGTSSTQNWVEVRRDSTILRQFAAVSNASGSGTQYAMYHISRSTPNTGFVESAAGSIVLLDSSTASGSVTYTLTARVNWDGTGLGIDEKIFMKNIALEVVQL